MSEGTRRIFSGFALAAVAAGVIVAVYLVAFNSPSKYIVHAYFKNSDGIRKDSDVKIGGVPGGQVRSLNLVKINGQDVADATLALDKSASPIGPGATAMIRPVNLLGEKYVDLSIGDTTRPLRSGTSIPVSATGAPVELDDVLNTLDMNTRARLRILINETGVGLQGRGADFNSLLQQLPPALDQTQAVLGEVAQQNQTLRSLAVKGDAVVGSITNKRADLVALVKSADKALQVTADRRTQLGNTIGQAPSTLTQLRGTLGQLQSTATNLIPASASLRQAAGPLAATLQNLPGFTSAAHQTLNTIQSVSPTLTRLGTRATPIVNRLQPTVDQLNTFATQLAPNVRTLDNGAMHELLGLFGGWVRTIQTADSLGHIFRLRLMISPEALSNTLESLTGNRLTGSTQLRHKAPKAAPAPTAAPQAAAQAAPAPTTTTPSQAPQHQPGLVNGLLGNLPVKVPPINIPLLDGTSGNAPADGQQSKGNAVNKLLNYLFGS